LRICVGDTVQYCLKTPQKAGGQIPTTAPRSSLRVGIITRLTFATNNQECRTVGQKMARITSFSEDESDDIIRSISPGRIIAVISRAPDMHPRLIPRVKMFFEKNDNCYRDCFMEWDKWTSEERAEYCARCTAGEMVAAAGIQWPTDDQVRVLLDRARAIVHTARTNVEAINLARGSGDEPLARRRRQSRTSEPRHFAQQTPGMPTGQQTYMPQDMGMGMMDPMMAQQQLHQQQQLPPEDLRRRKTGEGTSVPAVNENIQSDLGDVQPGGQTTEAMLLKQLAEYREINAHLHEEIARKERELRAEADRRVEEVRQSLTSEIERLSAQLKALVQRSSFS